MEGKMDFRTLLRMAKQNNEKKDNVNYYNTKYAPPKKESKEKRLSENIKKFLARREEEEKQRELEHREKVAKLLAMRDEKSKNKIRKMLKVTKSANKSVLADAINTQEQPEHAGQDDYGYESTEANAFYQRYIEKMKDVKDDKGFTSIRQQPKYLTDTKERVKVALEMNKHTSYTSSSSINKTDVQRQNSKSLNKAETEKQNEEQLKKEAEEKRKKNRKQIPPPMDFQALLKLAEKKQHEPIVLPVVVKKEPERLLTSKEKRELEERKRAREERERREKEALQQERNKVKALLDHKNRQTTTKCNAADNKNLAINSKTSMNNYNDNIKRNDSKKSSTSPTLSSTSSNASKSSTSSGYQTSKSNGYTSTVLSKTKSSINNTNLTSNTMKHSTIKTSNKNTHSGKDMTNGVGRKLPVQDVKASTKIIDKSSTTKTIQRTREFPTEKTGKSYMDHKKKGIALKRRIEDDDDDEYDSDMNDFIDDSDDEHDYSSHIKAIFGYDKSKYRYLNDEDDIAMESSYAQMQREEYISKKIGMQEDLEDMKQEALEKKRKMDKLKKRRI